MALAALLCKSCPMGDADNSLNLLARVTVGKAQPAPMYAVTFETARVGYSVFFRITQVTFTEQVRDDNIRVVVWQFWGRAAEAS